MLRNSCKKVLESVRFHIDNIQFIFRFHFINNEKEKQVARGEDVYAFQNTNTF
jgi:hypothetical protein